MSTIDLTTALFGRDLAVSRRLGSVAVALGAVAFGLAWVSSTLPSGGPLRPRALFVALALGTVVLGGVAALAGAFRNSGVLTCWLFVCAPVAGLAAFGALRGGLHPDTGPVDAILAGGLWGFGAAVTVGSMLFACGVVGRWADEGRFTV